MPLFTCLTCPPHSTFDHELNGLGACLISECPCKKMDPGAEFVKPARVYVSAENAIKQAAERAKRDRDA